MTDTVKLIDKKDVEYKATVLLKSLGMPIYLCGFKYLRTLIGLCVDYETYQINMTKAYKAVAELYSTSGRAVERAIRMAIAHMIKNNPDILHYEVFGKEGINKLSNKRFIGYCCEFIKYLQCAEEWGYLDS